MSEHPLGQCDEAQLPEVQALLLMAFSDITLYRSVSQSLFLNHFDNCHIIFTSFPVKIE